MHCAVNLINGEILLKKINVVSDFIGLTVYWGIRIIKQLQEKKIAIQSDKGCQQEVKNATEAFARRVPSQLVQKHLFAL